MYYENGQKVLTGTKNVVTRVNPDGSMIFDITLHGENGEVFHTYKETPPNPDLAFDPSDITPEDSASNIMTFSRGL